MIKEIKWNERFNIGVESIDTAHPETVFHRGKTDRPQRGREQAAARMS